MAYLSDLIKTVGELLGKDVKSIFQMACIIVACPFACIFFKRISKEEDSKKLYKICGMGIAICVVAFIAVTTLWPSGGRDDEGGAVTSTVSVSETETTAPNTYATMLTESPKSKSTYTPVPRLTPATAPTATIKPQSTVAGFNADAIQEIAVRTGPNTIYTELGTFPRSTEIKVFGCEWGDGVEWVLVEFEYNGKTWRGYTGIKRISTDEEIPKNNNGEEMCSISKGTIVYAAPSKNAGELGTMIATRDVILLNYDGEYAYIEFYNDSNEHIDKHGYSRGYVKINEINPSKQGTNYYIMNCMNDVPLYKEPSKQASTIDRIPLGGEVNFIHNETNGFAYVEYDGNKGYVLIHYIESQEDIIAHSGETVSIENCEQFVTFRSTPYYNDKGFAKLDLHTKVTYLGRISNFFSYIEYEDTKGFVDSTYLEKDADNARNTIASRR